MTPVAVTLVKLGGSLITDKTTPETARPEVLDRLAREIAATLEREETPPLILGHGSGSFGHPAAARFGIADGIRDPGQRAGISSTQAAAHRLHRLVLEALERQGVLAFSLPPSAWFLGSGGHPAVLTMEPLKQALRLGLVPVVCGDVLLDRDQGAAIVSTEGVLLTLAAALLHDPDYRVATALWLGNTPGVLDHRGQLLETLRSHDAADLGTPEGTDVTGGIKLRVETTLELARLGVDSLVADGRQVGLLQRALLGHPCPGTRVSPSRRG